MKRSIIYILLVLLSVGMQPQNGFCQDKDLYKKHKDEGDRLLAAGQHLKARESFQTALSFKDQDSYAIKKIKECQVELDKVFVQIKANADKLSSEGKCSQAIFAYDSALIYKPGDATTIAAKDNCDAKYGANTFRKNVASKDFEEGKLALQHSKGNYVFVGRSHKISGDEHVRVIVTKPDGGEVWNKMFGSTNTEQPASLIETQDGNLLIVGQCDPEASGNDLNIWLCKINASNGSVIWEKNFGSEILLEIASGVCQLPNGELALVAAKYPVDEESQTKSDLFLIRLDKNGEFLFEKKFGGAYNEEAVNILTLKDGFVVLANKEHLIKEKIYWNIWLFKTDFDGNLQWEQSFGGYETEKANNLIQTKDGGFAITGYTYSYQKNGGYDVYVVKTDANGKKIWDAVAGGPAEDEGIDIVENAAGDFFIVGSGVDFFTKEKYGKNESELGEEIIFVRFDANGKHVWTKTSGGKGNQRACGVSVSTDGGYIVTGVLSTNEKTDMFYHKYNRAGK